MADKSYVLCVNDPPPIYPRGYFPRKFKYKKEAVTAAKAAIAAGASFARVECPVMGEIDFRPEVPARKNVVTGDQIID